MTHKHDELHKRESGILLERKLTTSKSVLLLLIFQQPAEVWDGAALFLLHSVGATLLPVFSDLGAGDRELYQL